MQTINYSQWQAVNDALDQAVALRESGTGGGHALLIQILNQLGYWPLSSQEAEQIAKRIMDDGYEVEQS